MYRNIGINLIAVALFAIIASPVPGQAINEDLKILASDGEADNEFGYSIAIDQGIIAVGTPGDDDNGINSGSAYLFDALTGAQLAKLLPSDGAAGDEFGFSIAINGGIVAVGALRDDHNGVDSGSAYLFDATTGAQLAKLTPEDGAAGDEFGNSIAIDDGIVAIGAWRDDEFGDGSGSAYLFEVSTGDQLEKLLPDTGSRYQTFGVSIAMDDGIVVIGARTYFVLGEGYTFAKVYLFDVSTGNQINILQADIENYNGDLGGQFGDAVDIDDGIVAVGAWGRSIFFDHSGAAYLFDAASGSQLDFIFPSDGHDRDHFGNSISIDNGVVAIGAHQDGDNGWVAGSAYLYDALTGTQIDKLLASDGAQFDYFGSSIAFDDGVVAVGAIGDEDNGGDSGSAYIFDSGGTSNAKVPSYSIVDLGEFRHSAFGINTEGDIVGVNNFFTSQNRPERWAGGDWTLLEMLPNHSVGGAYQVSRDGIVVGYSASATGSISSPVRWVNDSIEVVDLGNEGGGVILSISSDSGHMAGSFRSGVGVVPGFVMDASGNITNTGTLADHNTASNSDVNNLGHTAGTSRFGGLITDRATFYSDATGLLDLGLLPGLNHLRSKGHALNDSSVVVGVSWRSFPSSESRAFAWTLANGIEAIGNSPYSVANDINNSGWIVGHHGTNEADAVAFIYREAEGLVELNSVLDFESVGWNLLQATAIDELGRIIGYGRSPSDELRTFLAVPIVASEILPESVLVTRGTFVSGGLNELDASDDSDFSVRTAQLDTQSRTEFHVKGVSPAANPSSIGVTLEGALDPGRNRLSPVSTYGQIIELYNYDDEDWEVVDSRIPSLRRDGSPVVVEATGDLSRFVETGTHCIEAKVRYTSSRTGQAFHSNTDQFKWIILP